MPDDDENEIPPIELDTDVPEPQKLETPEDFEQLKKFLFSSPSFRRVFFGTTSAFLLAVAGTAYVCINGPDKTHNPIHNGTAEKHFPELK